MIMLLGTSCMSHAEIKLHDATLSQWINSYVGLEQNFEQVKSSEGQKVREVSFAYRPPEYSMFPVRQKQAFVMSSHFEEINYDIKPLFL